MALIAVINKSTLVKDADVNTMCLAVQEQLNLHFCPAWGLKQSTIKFYSDTTKVPGYAWLFTMIDSDSDVPGALGFHTLSNSGKVEAFIMAQPILSNGGVVLYDPHNPNNYSVSGCLSHEALEAVADRWCAYWAQGTPIKQGSLYSLEVCDPVENQNVVVDVGTQKVFVSNFVFPSWFSMQATEANMPFDYLKSLRAPYTMSSGGYVCVANGNLNTAQQVFAPEMPVWRREMKQSKISRGARRLCTSSLWQRFVKWLKSEI